MITIPQANKENDHVRGITAYTPSQTTYIGISTADVFSNDGNVPANSEPEFTGYARIAVPNNGNTWNTSSQGKVTNKVELSFNEFSSESTTGIAKWIFESETANGTNDVMYYAKLEPEIPLTQYLTIRFSAGDIEFTRTNPPTQQSQQ